IAQNAAMLADSAAAPGEPPSARPPAPTPIPVPTRPTAATDLILSDVRPLLRNALQNYFNGEFEAASRDFETLTKKLPNNAWIWAFLGASQYSLYAFEADEKFKTDALASFKRAKSLRKWKDGLPDKYFSKRIRRVFESAG
ncbi:MAG TPA: hypothetical protein VFL80_04745, partial [Thermoanaerobaculia bacterium]|nr:hypothetical protein [Thermoanaerobaculia bacterium]